MDPIFFDSPAAFRDWLDRHHATEREVHVGYWKRHAGRQTLTWPESVDEALCYGWIDGVRHAIDADRYTIRFTPRKPTSTWSAVNIGRVAELTAEGRMRPAGLAAFEQRSAARSAIYAYERQPTAFDADDEREFRRHAAAWAFFEAQAAWYRRNCVHWVASAKRAETRARRLAALIDASARGQRR